MNIFQKLLVVAIPVYVISGIFMVKGMVKFKAESATATGETFKKLRNAMVDPFLVNVGASAYVIWHIQPLVVPHHHGPWFILNAFIAWGVTTLSWYLGIYGSKLFVPFKLLTLIFLYGSCINATFAKIGVSILTIMLGIIFFRKHRENWIVAVAAIAIGVFTLLKSMSVAGAGNMIWLAIEVALFIYFLVGLIKSGKAGKIVCAIVMAYLALELFHNARDLYYLFIFRG